MRKSAAVSAILVPSAAATATAVVLWPEQPQITILPQTVVIPAGPYSYRPSGNIRIGTRTVNPPHETRGASADLEIVKY